MKTEVNPKDTVRAEAFEMWGKYRKGWLKTTLPISFQFHHVQMDGGQGAMFMELLQREIRNC